MNVVYANISHGWLSLAENVLPNYKICPCSNSTFPLLHEPLLQGRWHRFIGYIFEVKGLETFQNIKAKIAS